MAYRVRHATLDDTDTLVRHRLAMFADMGVPFAEATLAPAFADWLRREMPSGSYRAWLVEWTGGEEDRGGRTTPVAGAGATIIPWPPGPKYPGDRLAFVYNVYTEPAHRRRGLARLAMDALHAWCCAAGVTSVALNASEDGQPLYAALGYAVAPNPMMFYSLVGEREAPAPAPVADSPARGIIRPLLARKADL
jgi:GNAT superfamily N-acetyltransferase